MKILELAEFYSRQGGGVRTYVDQKFEAAEKNGVDLTVLAPGPENFVEPRTGGKLIWVKSPPIPVDKRYHLFWDQKPIDEIVASEKPDFIEGASPWRGGWFAGRQSPTIPKALVIHQDPVLTYPQTLFRPWFSENQIDHYFAWFFKYFRRLQNRYDISIVSGAWLSQRLASVGLRRPVVTPFGVNRSEFQMAARREDARLSMLKDCGVINPRAKLLVTVSRHHPEKRLPLIIEAFRAASALAPMGLYIIGDGPSRAQIDKLAAKTQGVHVAGFIGDRSRLAGMLASSDAYIHGCPTETFGMVIAEALCAGLPQIAPRAGGAADLLSTKCAEFFEPDNARDCAGAIIRLFFRDEKTLRQAALRASQRIASITEHFEVLFTTYERLVLEKSQSRIQQFPIRNDLPIRHQIA